MCVSPSKFTAMPPPSPSLQILIQGPNARLIIGTENSPFTHDVVLTLTGRRNDVDLPLTRTLNLGSKAIGVFGNVRQEMSRESPAPLLVNAVVLASMGSSPSN